MIQFPRIRCNVVNSIKMQCVNALSRAIKLVPGPSSSVSFDLRFGQSFGGAFCPLLDLLPTNLCQLHVFVSCSRYTFPG